MCEYKRFEDSRANCKRPRYAIKNKKLGIVTTFLLSKISWNFVNKLLQYSNEHHFEIVTDTKKICGHKSFRDGLIVLLLNYRQIVENNKIGILQILMFSLLNFNTQKCVYESFKHRFGIYNQTLPSRSYIMAVN